MTKKDYYFELRNKIVRYCYTRNENMILNVLRIFDASKNMSNEYLEYFFSKKESGVSDSVIFNDILNSDYYMFLTEIFFYLDDNKILSNDMNFTDCEYNKKEYILAFRSFCHWHGIEDIYKET